MIKLFAEEMVEEMGKYLQRLPFQNQTIQNLPAVNWQPYKSKSAPRELPLAVIVIYFLLLPEI
jgi:hypothetical protein